ncbi:MAG: proteasome activator [Actinomycetes bacterium]
MNDYLQPQISPIVPTEVLDAPEGENPIADGTEDAEMIAEPGKVMRIGSMVKQLLDEVRQAPLDEAGRDRLRQIYETSLSELSDGLSPDLAAELRRVSIDFGPEIPSEAELRIAQAQLVGWLEGLFHGIQAALMAQQITARAQFEESRLRELPDPSSQGDGPRPGTYL